MTDIRQSPYWAAFMKELGWEVLPLTQGQHRQFAYIRKLPLFGKTLKAPRLSLPISFSQIDSLAQAEKIVFSKIEPNTSLPNSQIVSELKNYHYKSDRWALQPTKTIILNLTKSDDELLKNMEKDTRYSIRAAQRRGVRVVKSNDLNRFLKLYRQTAKRQKFWFPEKDLKLLWDIFSNEGKAYILIAVWNKTDIAGSLILHHDKTAYYYHAASLRTNKDLFAPYLLVWESMQTAKNLGLKHLDLEGVYDRRIPSTKKWRGFTHFKRGFRGEEVEFVGSFVKTYNPILSTFYNLGNFSFSSR
ncbi:MAG TPA: peptidoglycan bridge formation glycyltransferase FemA/FemB family protein [Candidatus Saccharimonadales bacterium]|nr:peptidoglycan bridge formation glycyltransferase FemA/FemB family protein [Candidatus Saccharimonadales bacterium]